jgi:DNA repair exonuclease SbcCD ATPase subunit
MGGLDPRAALDRFAERLEALQGRMGSLEEGAAPLAELSETLARLYAQKDATIETVFARLAPLEAKLGEIEARMGGLDPQAALERLSERFSERLAAAEAARAAIETRLGSRLEALERPAVDPLAGLRTEIEGLRGHRDAMLGRVSERLAGLEAALGALETRTLGEAEARAEAQAIAAQMIAARTVAEETRLFADRLSLLEASLPRLTLAQSLMMQALERQASTPGPAPRAALAAADGALAEIWRNPRVISLHQAKEPQSAPAGTPDSRTGG